MSINRFTIDAKLWRKNQLPPTRDTAGNYSTNHTGESPPPPPYPTLECMTVVLGEKITRKDLVVLGDQVVLEELPSVPGKETLMVYGQQENLLAFIENNGNKFTHVDFGDRVVAENKIPSGQPFPITHPRKLPHYAEIPPQGNQPAPSDQDTNFLNQYAGINL